MLPTKGASPGARVGVLRLFQAGDPTLVLRSALDAQGGTSYWENACVPVRNDAAEIIAAAEVCRKVTERVFELFFTTKEAGRGTGQGLAVSRSIDVDKHRGSLISEREVGMGTTFTVRLPVKELSESCADTPSPDMAVRSFRASLHNFLQMGSIRRYRLLQTVAL